jgi:ADP-heptose:LPS heptosyltransferase
LHVGEAMSAKRVSPIHWDAIRRILVVRLDNIGDVVMTGPALRALERAVPNVSITLLASPAGSEAAALLPWVDDVIVHRALWQDASGALPHDPRREQALVENLRAHRFDAAVIFTSFSQTPYPPAFLCYLADIPVRLGQARDFGGRVLSTWVQPPPDDTHQVDRNLFLLEATGIPAGSPDLELTLPSGAEASALQILHAGRVDPVRPFVVLAPGASCAARTYDPERYAVAARLLAEAGTPVVVVGRERDAALAAPILGLSGRYPVVSLVGRTSVPELAAVVSRAAVVVANNSSALHFADAFGRPSVILYSGTDLESQWRPRRSPAAVLRRSTSCSPCYGFRCPFAMECLDVEPGEIVTAASRLLEEHRGPAA